MAEHALVTGPLPDRVNHLWRYTDPALLVPPSTESAGTPIAAPPSVELPQEAIRAGVRVDLLDRAGILPPELGMAVPADHGVFEALNLASWNSGVVVRVPPGATLAEPLIVTFEAGAAPLIGRLLVLVGDGAEVALVEEHEGGSTGSMVFGVAELRVGAGAHLRHVLLQRWSAGVRGHLTQRAVIGRDATAVTVVGSLGGKLLKADVGTVLDGEGAHSEIIGMSLGEKKQHVDLHTEHRHRAPRTTSDMDIRAALTSKAHSAYTGLIRIEEDASACEAFQKDRNLLLSPRAKAETIPELEILNNDVSCSHGATASPVDPEQLFYLQSRGLAPDEAVRTIARGFLEPVIARVPASLRDRVAASVERRVLRLKGANR